MKKLFIIPILFLSCIVHGQTVLCLGTQCIPVTAKVGDTAIIGATLTASNKVASTVFKQLSGPSTATLTPMVLASGGFLTSLSDTVKMKVANLVVGTYTFQVTGTDQAGGTVVGIDSLIVAAAPVACPTPRTAVSTQITINGVIFTIPLTGAKVTYSDGVTQ